MGRPPCEVEFLPEGLPIGEFLNSSDFFQAVFIFDPEFWYPEWCWQDWLDAVLERPESIISLPLGNQNPEWRIGLDVPLYLTVAGLEQASRFRADQVWLRKKIKSAAELCTAVIPREILATVPDTLALQDLPEFLVQHDKQARIYCRGWLHNFNALGDAGCRHDLIAMTRWKGLVLEMGCGKGLMARTCREAFPGKVTWVGMDYDCNAIKQAAGHMDLAVRADADQTLPFGSRVFFDIIVCGDFLEHLAYPWQFLSRLKQHAATGCRLLASVPNIGHWSVVEDLLQGRFDEAPAGIMCVSHLRFGTAETWTRWLKESGWKVKRLEEERLAMPDYMKEMIRMFQAGADHDSLETLRYRIMACPE